MRKIALVSIIVFVAALLKAQSSESTSFIQISPLAGIDFGYVKVENSDWESLGIANEINELKVQNKFGFSLGLMYRFNISEQFSIAPQTIIAFQKNMLIYDLENQDNHQASIRPALIELPLHFVFSQSKNKKVSPQVFGGGRYTHDISKQEPDVKLNLKKNNFAIDLGTGLDIAFNKFSLKPELIYSFGVVNLKNNDADLFNSAIERISRDKISFRIVLSG